MAAWESRVEDLLYDGEGVQHQVGGEETQVVVTTHRVLTFTPETAGPNFRAVERPNVSSISRETDGETRWLVTAGKWLTVGVVLIVVGVVVDFEGMLAGVTMSQEAGQVGIGGIMGMFALLKTFFALVDDALLLGGALSALGGLAALGWYLNTRAETITIAVAGQDDIQLPADGLTDTEVAGLSEAVKPG